MKFCSTYCSNFFNKNRPVENRKNQYGIPRERLICKTCLEEKNFNSFSYIDKFDYHSDKKEMCKKCSKNLEEAKRRDKTWKYDTVKILLSNARQRAKKKNMEFSLIAADIIIPDVCPVFNIPLKRETRDTWFSAPSIDRIDNTKGYIKDNIIIVSRRANLLKKDATVDELVRLAEFYKLLS